MHLDIDDRSNEARLHVAGELAKRFEATVIGSAAADIRSPVYFVEGDAAADVLEKERAWLDSKIAECHAEFQLAALLPHDG